MTPEVRFLELAEVVALLDSPNVQLQFRALETLRRGGVIWTELVRELGFTLRDMPRPQPEPPPPPEKPPAASTRTQKIPPLAERLRARAERLERLRARGLRVQ